MSAPHYITAKDAIYRIPNENVCILCKKPYVRAMKSKCCHHMCHACFLSHNTNGVVPCGYCHSENVWEDDPATSAEAMAVIVDRLLQHSRRVLALQLPSPLDACFVAIGKRFVDVDLLRVDAARLRREMEEMQRSVATGFVNTSDAHFDFSRIPTCTSAEELEAVANKETMQYLTLEGEWFQSVKDLEGFDRLQVLELKSCPQLLTLAGIDRLTALTHLIVEDCGVDGDWGLIGCPQLRHMAFTRCPNFIGLALPIPNRDSNFLATEANKETSSVLRVMGCPLFYVVAATACSLKLETFEAVDTAFADLDPLRHSIALGKERLADPKVADSTAGTKCASALRKLTLWKSGVSDISSLSTATGLEELDLGWTPVRDITPLQACVAGLRELNLWDTGVHDISALQEATNLEVLDIGRTRVHDITALTACLPVLRILKLANTDVTEITVLQKAARLEVLDISGTKVEDTSLLPASVTIIR